MYSTSLATGAQVAVCRPGRYTRAISYAWVDIGAHKEFLKVGMDEAPRAIIILFLQDPIKYCASSNLPGVSVQLYCKI